MDLWHKFDWARLVIVLMMIDVVLVFWQLNNINLVEAQWLRWRMLAVLAGRWICVWTLGGLAVAAIHAHKQSSHKGDDE